MSGPYRTLFTGTLVQDAALSVGGADPDLSLVDSSLSRDGQGRYVLRGQSLAGALIATARKLRQPLPNDISSHVGRTKQPKSSRWHVFTSHPEGLPKPEFRQHVGIRQDTGTAAAGVLYDVEVLPRGTRWPLLLEVNTSGDGGAEAERLAAAALLEWRHGRCWLGREVARGLGWLRLDALEARRLDTSYALKWPDSRKMPWDVIKGLNCEPIPAGNFGKSLGLLPAPSMWNYLEVEGTVRAGVRSDEYGLDALSVGGHAAGVATPWASQFLSPEGRKGDIVARSFVPDETFVMTRGANGAPEPFLPGSGLRGPLRHALSRALRQRGEDVCDPNGNGGNDRPARDLPGWLFGTLRNSAALLVRDAHLVGDNWTAAWVQHHAEDEFSGGVFGSGKFDRAILVEGCFSWKMVVEYRHGQLFFDRHRDALLEVFGNFAESGHLPIGAAKWRSAGWPIWSIERKLWGRAGEEPHEL
jgi:hypothetical protein